MAPLDNRLRRQFGYGQDDEGVVITNVDRGSDAYRDANIRQGDLLLEIAGTDIRTIDDAEAAFANAPANRPILMTLRRAGGDREVTYRTALIRE